MEIKLLAQYQYVYIFTSLYLLGGGIYFLRDFNTEFIIYIFVIVIIFSGVLLLHRRVLFPAWMLWFLSIWGLMHVLGGAVQIGDHTLFAHKIYPFLDNGGEFYILKYDQVVHAYLYGLVATMSHYVAQTYFQIRKNTIMLATFAVLTSVGISGLNEIMEFLISLGMENGVGGYDNTMLDMCFNLCGAVVAIYFYIKYILPSDKSDAEQHLCTNEVQG